MAKSPARLDKEIAAITADRHIAAINHAWSRDPDALIAAVRDAKRHVAAMKRRAPEASGHVDSRGEFDPEMYDLLNLIAKAKPYVRNIKKIKKRKLLQQGGR